jgi:outer membrane protein assembly factor BamB
MQRRRFLQLSAGAAASVPLRAFAKPKPAEKIPDVEIVDGKEVRHGIGAVQPNPYPWHKNAVAKLPAWDGATTSDSVPGSMRMYRGNLGGTYYGSGKVPDQLRVIWKFRTSDFATKLRGKPSRWMGTGWTGQALKYGDYVFAGTVGGHFHCWEALTGKLVWVFKSEKMFKGSPCLYKNRIYVPNVDDHIRCLDAATGKLVWDWSSWADNDSSPRIFDGLLYTGGEDGDLKCMNTETGKMIWKHAFGRGTGDKPGSDGIESSLAIADGIAYFGHLDGNVRAFDLKKRKLAWATDLGTDIDATALIVGDKLYIGVENAEGKHAFHCLDRANGKSVWSHDIPGGTWSSAATSGKHVIVGGSDAKLHCLDAATGRVIWQHEIGENTWASPQVVDGKVLFGAWDPWFRSVDATTGKLISRVDLGERCYSGAAVEDGHVWVGSASGFFYCLGK